MSPDRNTLWAPREHYAVQGCAQRGRRTPVTRPMPIGIAQRPIAIPSTSANNIQTLEYRDYF